VEIKFNILLTTILECYHCSGSSYIQCTVYNCLVINLFRVHCMMCLLHNSELYHLIPSRVVMMSHLLYYVLVIISNIQKLSCMLMFVIN